jgi:tRNA(Arg) A34 adenosine deaminase TadA
MSAAELWASLDDGWRIAFEQAWEALRAGSIPVGACLAEPGGRIVHASRNRTAESSGPPGEVWGSGLAHAEINVVARIPRHNPEPFVLTTTLEPCLQCAAAIRLAKVGVVRFAGADPYWSGCHDFGRLMDREAARPQPQRIGPRDDAAGRFAQMIAFLGPLPNDRYLDWMRDAGESAPIDLALRLRADGGIDRLAALPVGRAFSALEGELALL